jgi:RNA polymerase sigma-70 factor (ECF subfamily)
LKEPLQVELEPTHDESGIPEALVNIEVEHLMFMMRQLPAIYQMTLNMYAIEGYEYQEIANILGVNIGSVKSNLFKARAKLKTLLTHPKEQETHAG